MDRYVTDIKNGCYQNPVLPMDFSDPDAIRVGEDYYLISSSFTYLPGVPVLHSKDLVHWERIGNCVERLPFDRYAQPAHGCGTWAPALRYHAGRFYAFIPLPDEGIFYTEATDPAGPWSALHCVKSASGWIDPCPLWDDDGSVYMAHAFAKSRCGIKHKIQLSRLDPETLEVVEDGPIVFDGTLSQPTAEGPKMYKRNGWYYIFIPAGGVEYGWQTVLRARNVYGPYEEKIVMHQGASSINGPHQGAWVIAPDGSDWFLHFQDRFELGRVVHLQPMCWHSDWPFIGLEQNGDGIGEPVTEWDCPKGEAGPGLQIGDSFTNGKPGLQWQWQANPQPEAWLRPVAGDALHLVCGASGSLWRQPNVLSQMLPAADFTANVTEEEAFLTGDGKNKPTGLLNATGGGEVGVTTAADSIKADEVIDLVYKLKRPYRKNAAFITSDSTLAQIRKLKDSNGNYLWQPALTAGEPDRILGYPVYTSVYMPKIAKGAAVMAFGDYSYYNIGDRGTRSIAELKELYAANGLVGFVSKERVDGKLILPEAVQIMKMKAA